MLKYATFRYDDSRGAIGKSIRHFGMSTFFIGFLLHQGVNNQSDFCKTPKRILQTIARLVGCFRKFEFEILQGGHP
jgi:hypothetical protein